MTDLFDHRLERERQAIEDAMHKAPREAKPAWRRVHRDHVTKMLESETGEAVNEA